MHKLISVAVDLVIITFAFLLALLVRFGGVMDVVDHQWTTLIFIYFLSLVIFYFFDLYTRMLYAQKLRLFYTIIKVCIVSLLVYVVVGFATKFYFLIDSRAFIIMFYAFFSLLFLFIRLALVPKLLEHYFSRLSRRITCTYIGPTDEFAVVKKLFDDTRSMGLSCVACDKTDNPKRKSNEMFLYSQSSEFSKLYQEIKTHVTPGVTLYVASKLFSELNLNTQCFDINDIPVYTFCHKKNQPVRETLRRCIDIVGSLLALIILTPFLLIIALAIKLDSHGPVIYKQKRCSKDGKEFTLYKFRSMYSREKSDEEREIEYRDYIERKISKGKVIDDTEITPVGRVLRRTSLDELPQFINVLKGDMSLIGPRPPIPYEVKHYKEWHMDRLLVKPGLSGLWQIHGRGSMPCDSSIFLDLMYIINRSLTLDMKLIVQTFPAVILGKGAY